MSKPWMTPMAYNEDRFDDEMPPPRPAQPGKPKRDAYAEVHEGYEAPGSPRDAAYGIDGDDAPRRGRSWDRGFKSLDDEPLNYSRGPHDQEFGVDDNDG